jgi:hypothetical protein
LPKSLSSWQVGDYEFDLDRRVARQFGDSDCGTGMQTAFSEKFRKQFRSCVDDLRLLVEVGRRGDETRHLQHPVQTRQVAERFLEAGQRLQNADARRLATRSASSRWRS